MKRALQKITITFILIGLIPVGFVIFELTSLSDNEKAVTKIYQNQLDAILYSVNQYTDDVFSSWAAKTDLALARINTSRIDTADYDKAIMAFSQMSAVRQMYVWDFADHEETFTLSDSVSHVDYQGLLRKAEDRLTKLKTYQRGGFRKIETYDTLLSGQFIPVYFLLDEEVSSFRVAVMLVDLNAFVQNVLGPRLQTISRGEFVISAFRRRDNEMVYSTEAIHPNDVPEPSLDKEITQKEIWLLPGYYLTISLRDATIKELVSRRAENSMLIFAVLFVLLIAGILFLYANIRREMLLSQSKSEFVSNVSHEIRTPLSLISMYTETLEMGRVPEERKHEYYSIILKETARLSMIVNRILNFAQADASKKKYAFQIIDLNLLAQRVASSYEPHMKERGFTFEFHQFGSPLAVRADDESVTEALLNLLDNAVKYSKDEKEVKMRTGSDGVVAFVEVEDRGIGIPRVHQRDIFEQFYRVPTNNVHNIKGTGLGLALVKRTMSAHGGRAKVFSSPGKGSIFTLYFPLVKGETAGVGDHTGADGTKNA